MEQVHQWSQHSLIMQAWNYAGTCLVAEIDLADDKLLKLCHKVMTKGQGLLLCFAYASRRRSSTSVPPLASYRWSGVELQAVSHGSTWLDQNGRSHVMTVQQFNRIWDHRWVCRILSCISKYFGRLTLISLLHTAQTWICYVPQKAKFMSHMHCLNSSLYRTPQKLQTDNININMTAFSHVSLAVFPWILDDLIGRRHASQLISTKLLFPCQASLRAVAKIDCSAILPMLASRIVSGSSLSQNDVKFFKYQLSFVWASDQALAFWNSFSQGLGPSGCKLWFCLGYQGFCHIRKHLSGCGIMAKCLPSGEQSAAMPDGDPLGLKGYCSVTFCSESQYLQLKTMSQLDRPSPDKILLDIYNWTSVSFQIWRGDARHLRICLMLG